MFGIKVLVLLQIVFQLMVAGQEIEDVTLPSIENSTLADNETTDWRILSNGYIAYPEFGFAYKDSETEMSYNEARIMCSNEGAQLAMVDSREKAHKLIHRGLGASWVGLGLGIYYQTDEWITVDGKSTSNLPWGNDQPSGEGKCVYLSNVNNGLCTWSCNETWYALCEIALPSSWNSSVTLIN